MGIERMNSSASKSHMDGVLCECPCVCSCKHTWEVFLAHPVLVHLLKLLNLLSPVLFHHSKTTNIQALQCMSAVGRVCKNNNVCFLGMPE